MEHVKRVEIELYVGELYFLCGDLMSSDAKFTAYTYCQQNRLLQDREELYSEQRVKPLLELCLLSLASQYTKKQIKQMELPTEIYKKLIKVGNECRTA